MLPLGHHRFLIFSSGEIGWRPVRSSRSDREDNRLQLVCTPLRPPPSFWMSTSRALPIVLSLTIMRATITFSGATPVRRGKLSQSVLALDLFLGQSPDAWPWPTAVCYHQRYYDLPATRCISDSDLHRVEMTTDEGRILMAQRNINRRASTSHLLRRWDQGCAFFDSRPKWRSELRMKDCRRML
jgi:hypothetical protein